MRKFPKLECMWEGFHFTLEHNDYENKWVACGKKMMAEKNEYISCESPSLNNLFPKMKKEIDFYHENF